MAINSRDKGNRFERDVAKTLSKWTGYKFGRTPGSGAFSTRSKDPNLAGDVYAYEYPEFPFIVECKSYKDYNLIDLLLNINNFPHWIAQAEREAKAANKKVMLVIKKNYQKPLVVIKLDEEPDVERYFIYKGYYIMAFDNLKESLLTSLKRSKNA